MCEKIVFIILMLIAIIHSEEISLSRNKENADIFNFRLRKIIQGLPPYNEQRSTKTRSRRSILLLVPLMRSEMQSEQRQPRETVQKTKRCFDTPFRKNRFPSSSTRKNTGRSRSKNPDANTYVGASRRHTDNFYTHARDAKYSPDGITASSWMEYEARKENEILRRILEDKLNAKDVIVHLDSQEKKAERCDTGKYVCYCSEQNCSQKSSKASSSRVLGSSRRMMPGKSNRQRPMEYENARSNPDAGVLQRELPQLYRESPRQLRLLMGPVNSFPVHYYPYRAPHTLYGPVPYGISSPVIPHTVENRKRPLDFGIPYASLGDRQDPFVESNQPIFRQNSQEHRCSSEENRFEASGESISSLTSDNDVIFNEAMENDLVSTDPKIEKNGNSQNKYFPKLNTKLGNNYADGPTDSIKRTDFQPIHLIDSKEESDATEFSGSDETVGEILETKTTVEVEKAAEKMETIERSGAEVLPKLITTVPTNYVGSTAKPEMTNNPGLYSASETTTRNFNEEPFRLSHINAKTGPMDENDLNSDYSETTVRNSATDQSALTTDLLRATTLSQTDYNINGPAYPEDILELNYLDKNVEKSRMDTSREIIDKTESEDSVEAPDRNQDDHFSEVTTSSLADHIDMTTHDGRLIDSEECMKLFGRDVCVLKAIPSRIHTGVLQNSPYSTVTVPGYIVQASAKKSTTENYANTLGTTNANFVSLSTIGEIEELNNDANENLESTSLKSNADVRDEASRSELHRSRFSEQIYDRNGAQRNSDEDRSPNISENARIPKKNVMEKMTNETIVKITANARNKSLGKSKSRVIETLAAPNYNERLGTASPTTNEKSLYSTKSHGFNVDEETNGLMATPTVKIDSYKSTHCQKASTIPDYDYKTRHNLEEESTNKSMMKSTTSWEETLRKQPTTARYLDHNKIDDLIKNQEGDVENSESLVTITDSSAGESSFSNNLILNSIKKVIKNFALDTSSTRTEDLDQDTTQMQGKNSPQEILRMQNIKSILSTPQIENTIVKRVKSLLPDITDTSAKNFADECSYNLIRNILRRLLQDSNGSHQQQLPPTVVEEHRFKHGQWQTDLATLPPRSDFGKQLINLKNLPGDVEHPLGSPAIASQTNSRIVQSSRNRESKDKERGKVTAEIDDSTIHRIPSNTLQASEGLPRTDASMQSDESQEIELVTDGQGTNINVSQKTSACNRDGTDCKVNENLGNPTLDGIKKFDGKGEKITIMNNDKITSYQKAKALGNIPTVLIAPEPSYLPESHGKNKNKYVDKEIPLSSTAYEDNEMKENTHQTYGDIKQTGIRDDEEAKLGEKVVSRHDSSDSFTTVIPSDLTKLEKSYEESKSVLPKVTTISPTILGGLTSETEEILAQNEVGTKNTDELSRHEEEIINDMSDERTIVHQQSALFGNNVIVSTTMKQSDLLKQEESSKIHVSQEASVRTNEEDSYAMEEIARGSVSDGITYISPQYNEAVRDKEPQKIALSVDNSVGMSIASERSHLPLNRAHEITNAMSDTSSVREDIDMRDEAGLSTSQTSQTDMREATRAPLKFTFLGESGDISSPRSAIFIAKDKIEGDEITANEASDKTLNADPTLSANNVTEYSIKHDDDDTAVMHARDNIDELSINYYSQNNRILDYIRNHPADNGNEKVAITAPTVNFKQESSPDYARLSKTSVEKNGENFENRNAEIVLSPSMDGNLLRTHQQGLAMGNVIKIHEVTTEMQKTYTRTTYFNTSLKPEENLRDNSSPIIHETVSVSNDNRSSIGNGSSNSNNLVGNKIDEIANTTAEANETIISTTTLLSDDSYSLQLFSSSTTTSEKSISQLEESQLYYINDNVKIPLEIRKLKDGSYALSISKSICEEIMKRKCPCCVPLQGHVVQSARKDDTRANNVQEDPESVHQPPTTTVTEGSIPRKSEEEVGEDGANSYHLLNDRIKRHFIKNSSAITLMPVPDFARKYNLSLDFDEKEILLNEIGWHNEPPDYDKSLTKSMKRFELDQSKDKDADDNIGRKEEEKIIREEKGTLAMNTKNFTEIGLQKISTEINQPKMTEESKLYKLKTAGNTTVLDKKERGKPAAVQLIKLNNDEWNVQRMNNVKQNVPEIKTFKEEDGKPYRYQRNINGLPNKGVEIAKTVLYWLKSLFVAPKNNKE